MERNDAGRLLELPQRRELKDAGGTPKKFSETATRGYREVREIYVGWSTHQEHLCGVDFDVEGRRLRDGNAVHSNSSARVFLALPWMLNRRLRN